MQLSAGYWFYTAARLSEIDLTHSSGFMLQSCQPDGIFKTYSEMRLENGIREDT